MTQKYWSRGGYLHHTPHRRQRLQAQAGCGPLRAGRQPNDVLMNQKIGKPPFPTARNHARENKNDQSGFLHGFILPASSPIFHPRFTAAGGPIPAPEKKHTHTNDRPYLKKEKRKKKTVPRVSFIVSRPQWRQNRTQIATGRPSEDQAPSNPTLDGPPPRGTSFEKPKPKLATPHPQGSSVENFPRKI